MTLLILGLLMSSIKADAGVNFGAYIDTITAVDPQTVEVKAKLDASGKVVNPLQVVDYLGLRLCYPESLDPDIGSSYRW